MAALPQSEPGVLIDAYIDDALDDAGFAALCDWLRADEHNRRAFARALALHAGIADWSSDRAGGLLIPEFTAQENSEQTKEASGWLEALAELEDDHGSAQPIDFTDELARRKAVELKRGRRRSAVVDADSPLARVMVIPRPLVWLAGAAAILLLTLVLWPSATPPGRTPNHAGTQDPGPSAATPAVGRVVSSVDAQWASPLDAGGVLRAGQTLTLTQGLVQITFNDGAHVILEAPATLKPTGTNGLRLVSGKLTASVPPSAHGFTVATASGLITDYGTEFGVHVNPDGQTLAHTFTGRIGLTPIGGGEEMQLLADDAIVADSHGQVRVVEPDALAFVREEEFAARVDAEASAHARWLAYRYSLQRDPQVLGLFLADSIAPGQDPSALPNLAGSNGRAVSVSDARFVERANRTADGLRFDSDGDAFTFEVGDTLDEVTLLVWAKIDPADGRDLRTLIASDENNTPGAIHWNLYFSGEKSTSWIGLRDDLAEIDRPWQSYSAFFEGGRVPQGWHLYAVSINGQTGQAKQYVDGVLLAESGMPYRGPLVLGTTRIGAWLMAPELGNHTRVLSGTVGLVAVIDGALDTNQMRALYGHLSQAQSQGGTPPAPPDF